MTTTRYDKNAKNVLGQELVPCSLDPVTGFYRNGCCETGPHDLGLHTVCAEMTAEFLALSKYLGNDLSTPRPEYGFAGLRLASGDPPFAVFVLASPPIPPIL